ncbi:MAG TPA: hypothetical protein VIT62_02515 [Lysobacter sp.]
MFGLLSDIAKVALAPVKVAGAVVGAASDVAREITRPIADEVSEAAEAIAKDLRDLTK